MEKKEKAKSVNMISKQTKMEEMLAGNKSQAHAYVYIFGYTITHRSVSFRFKKRGNFESIIYFLFKE